ncbi:pyridoxal-dependent decarboxylase domain-containing protein 1 isoform X4 [Cricetulus griseus]|nr:pyridoxal-dependent decarboxylase domain-containing protein 1 isoform X4 [Cricetulus griseus]XP_016831245.1 pyridoxal-dependent decarboxylase domain-containing protein 1 isoform X4 [Cricetulus griseus]XP_027243699.1 pyridoxal-dependent decarboxylase domain-containing protein 1 isoform X4 [Cricetulus griseus]XP_027243700.1 pyridoxal-dependent decarboxylase domain-containing protein 1 isoform X4 [Cricetulus griseus]
MGKNLKEAMRMLESSQRTEEENGKKPVSEDIPGPLQGSGQDMVSILQLVQNLMHGDEDEEPQSTRIQNIGEQGHMALLGHSLGAYISTLDKEKLRKLTTRILSDTTLWLRRIFRYENGCAYFHEEEREGLAKICRLAIHSRYEDFVVDGFDVLYNKKPVIYLSAAARPGLGQYLCNQLGLPVSCLCRVPCNTMFGSQHQMDIAFLEKLIKDDIEKGRLPLLLVASAGTAAVGHTDKIGRLKELCEQYGIWLHVEGVNLATLALGYVSSSVLAATKCDSMTLTPGPWLGLPAIPAVTLYKHDDPALTLVAGLTSNKPADKLRALPLWLSLQYLGLDGIVERIKHACQLSQRLQESLKKVDHIKILVEDELSSPVVVFRFFQELPGSDPAFKAVPVSNVAPAAIGRERDPCDALNRWLGEQLKQLVPMCGLTVMDLEVDGTCVRFSPLMTAAGLGTRGEDVDQLITCIQSKLPVLTCTLQLREEFRQEVEGTASLLYVDDPTWPGIGVVRYEHANDDNSSLKSDPEGEKIHTGLLKKLNELESDLIFKMGPEYKSMKSCIYIGMASDDVDVSELVETIAVTAREIEENSRLLENMTEVVRKGIQEAQVQLQKANEERLLEEGVLRQIPVVGSVLNWFSPVQASQKGRSFNLTAGSLESTEYTYVHKVQGTGVTPPPTPSGTRSKQRLPGQKPFKRSLRGSDAVSETSSVSHIEDLEKVEQLSSGLEHSNLEAHCPEQAPRASAPTATQTEALQNKAQHPEDDHPQVEGLERLR